MKNHQQQLFLFFGLIWSTIAQGQIVANDANATIASYDALAIDGPATLQ